MDLIETGITLVLAPLLKITGNDRFSNWKLINGLSNDDDIPEVHVTLPLATFPFLFSFFSFFFALYYRVLKHRVTTVSIHVWPMAFVLDDQLVFSFIRESNIINICNYDPL